MAKIEKMEGGHIVVPNCAVTETSWERMVGLLGRDDLPKGAGLWIEPCNSIHTFFMRFPIDAVFLGKDRRVLFVKSEMAPWRITQLYWRARSVLELPAGDAHRLGICAGDLLRIREIN